jgi:capsular polysaccharide biosynthesis protein
MISSTQKWVKKRVVLFKVPGYLYRYSGQFCYKAGTFKTWTTMKKLTTLTLPRNISDKEMHLFEPERKFKLAPLKTRYLKNVFVANTGFCLNKKGLVKESHHNYPQQYNIYLKEASHYYYDVTDHPENLVYLDDENTYLLIHHPWFMYYHWICESILRLWMVKDRAREMVLILPEHYGETEFVMSSLEPFQFKSIYFIPDGKSLYVRNLCLPQIKTVVESHDCDKLRQVREFYLHYALTEKQVSINKGERIYISRKKAARKKVANEEDIIPLLLRYGFVILNNEDFNFYEQISIYSNAKYLVSIHGSGLTNMLFAQPGTKVLEFLKRQTNPGDWHSNAFWYLTEALDYEYYQQICAPTDPNDDYFHAHFIVDITLLEKNLKMMFAERD